MNVYKCRRRSTVQSLALATVCLVFLVQFISSPVSQVAIPAEGMIHAQEIDCLDPQLQRTGVDLWRSTKVVLMDFMVPGEASFTGKLTFRPYMNCADQEEDMLANLVAKEYFHYPGQKPYYNFSSVSNQPTQQTKDIIDLVYHGPENVPEGGFFIESGSYDGVIQSVSLELERQFGWSGILVEANPAYFHSGLSKKRNSISVNTCLGIEQRPHYTWFNFNNAVELSAGVSMGGIGKDSPGSMQLQCIPLYTIIKAAGNPKINVLVLDLEGADLMVLKTIPWDKVDIEILSVETDLIGAGQPGGENQNDLIEYVVRQGYAVFNHREEINPNTGLHQNHLFVRKDVVRKHKVRGYKNNYKVKIANINVE